MVIVADGAPGLIKAVERCWPASDRQHCVVHRLRNLLAKLPERERERVRQAYWQALDDAREERDGKQGLQTLVDQLLIPHVDEEEYHSRTLLRLEWGTRGPRASALRRAPSTASETLLARPEKGAPWPD